MNLFHRELLEIADQKVEFFGDSAILNAAVAGFSINSLTILPGEIFIAIKGERFDGHQFVADVMNKGNRTVVVTAEWYRNQGKDLPPGNYFVVADTLAALQNIGSYYRRRFNIPVIALTGSNGKTTTKEMIAAVLQKKYKVLKNSGNLNNHIGVPLTLFNLTAEHELVVLEMGTNHFGEIKKLAEIAGPEYGLITNIGPAHLEFFGSLKGVFKAKRELWDYLEEHGKIAFINLDDPYLASNLPGVNRLISFAMEKTADFRARLKNIDELGRASFQVEDTEIRLKIIGVHNVYNALAAFAVGRLFGVETAAIQQALQEFEPADKRMQVIETKGIRIVNDCYNSNSASAKKALLTLSQMKTRGKRISVLGDMLELGQWSENEHRKVGEFIASLKTIDYLLTYGEKSRETAAAAESGGAIKVKHCETKDELISFLISIIEPGDLLLIKGSRGMAMEEITKALTK